MSSSRPVSSPTRTMWTARGGKTPASAMGWARPAPAPRAVAQARPPPAARTWLASISLTTARAGIMATPLRSSVPRIRVKRATSVLTMTSPTSGSRSSSAIGGEPPARRGEHHAARQQRPPPPRGRAATSSAGSTPLASRRISVGSGIARAEVLEDGGEARDHEGHEEDDGGRAHAGEQHGIDQRGDQRVAELLRLLEKLGEAPQRGLEHAALLARPHHVDVEAREGPRVVLGERVGQRGAAAHAAQHVAHDRAQARGRRQIDLDGERAVERQPGLERAWRAAG